LLTLAMVKLYFKAWNKPFFAYFHSNNNLNKEINVSKTNEN
jgi:hypothetical protein